MTLWRISNHQTLDGGGGLRAPGRWHSRGQRVVYCATSPAAALLEVLAHAEIDWEDMPKSLKYLEVEVRDGVSEVEARGLPKGWERKMEATRGIGDKWLKEGRSLLMRVPSVVAPETWNVVMNPLHGESGEARIVRVVEWRVDERLLR